MGALILYMISGGFTAKTPDEITVQDFIKLVEENKVQAVYEALGSGLYSGLYTGSSYTTKDLPSRADFTFSCSEEEFSKNMSLLVAKAQNKDADEVSSVDYPFTYTVAQPKGQSWLVVILSLSTFTKAVIRKKRYILEEMSSGMFLLRYMHISIPSTKIAISGVRISIN